MMKKLLSLLTILIISSSSALAANYNQEITPEIASGIRKYKTGNYVGCLQDISLYLKKNKYGTRNQLAMYYMGMAYTQAGQADNAKFFYQGAQMLNPNNTLGKYAQKGIVCIDDPANCYINEKEEVKPEEKLSELDKFIRAPYGNGLSTNLNKELERKKVERLRKEMNSDQELNKYEFKDFRDFSIKKNNNKSNNVKKTSLNLNDLKMAQGIKEFYAQKNCESVKIASSTNPTDAEIVEALRVLNAAGLTNIAKQAENAQAQKEEAKPAVSEVKSEYKPDVTREEYQQQIQREMLQAQMAAMSQPNIDALFGNNNNNNNQNNMMNSNMMNMLPFMMAQQAAQNANGTNQQPMMSPEMMQTMMFNSMMPNMNFGLGGNN